MQYTYCEYHSAEWMLLVETGWVTLEVLQGNQAKMVYVGKP